MSENRILTHAAKILNERQDEYGDDGRVEEELGEAHRHGVPAEVIVLPAELARPEAEIAEDLIVGLQRTRDHPDQRVDHHQRGNDQEDVLEKRRALAALEPFLADGGGDLGGGRLAVGHGQLLPFS